MVLDENGSTPWDKNFYGRYRQKKVTENVQVGGVWVTHSFYTRSYWIDTELTSLWY